MGRDTHGYLVWMRDQLSAERWYHENEPENEPDNDGVELRLYPACRKVDI